MPSLGNGTARVGPANNALALILGERVQEGDTAPATGVVRSKCGLSRTLISAPRLLMRSMMWTPSIIERVARSHSASIRTSPVPSSSMAGADVLGAGSAGEECVAAGGPAGAGWLYVG